MRWRRWIAAGLCIGLCVFARAEGWAKYRVWVPHDRAAQRLLDSPLRLAGESVTLGPNDVLVGPDQLFALWDLGMRFRMVEPVHSPDWWVGQPRRESGDYTNTYFTNSEIIAQYEKFRLANPRTVSRQQIATTLNNRPVWAYRFSPGQRGTSKPPKTILLIHGIHAREWISPAVGMYLFHQLIEQAKSSRKHMDAAAKCALVVVPVLNPDGYEYTWTNDRYWRKNLWRNSSGVVRGVDLNRNFKVGWGGPGSSGTTSSDTYRGPSAQSEPEVRGLYQFAQTIEQSSQLVGFVDWHSYGQIILWPWGYQSALSPDNARFSEIGLGMQSAILGVHGRYYTAGPTYTAIYPASGISNDTMYGDFGTLGFGVELRGGPNGGGFVLPEAEILPTQQESWAGFEHMFLKLAKS